MGLSRAIPQSNNTVISSNPANDYPDYNDLNADQMAILNTIIYQNKPADL